jgi:hypothetical protein
VRSRTANNLAAATRAEFKRHRDQLLEYVRHLDPLIEGCADKVRLDAAMLRQERERLQQHADQITVQLRSRKWFYFGLLQTAVNNGIDLRYTSPVKAWTAQAQKEERPLKPHGPGIDYLITAAAAQGYVIGPDRARDLIASFNKMQIGAEFAGAGKLVVAVQIFDKDGNEVLDDANRPMLDRHATLPVELRLWALGLTVPENLAPKGQPGAH